MRIPHDFATKESTALTKFNPARFPSVFDGAESEMSELKAAEFEEMKQKLRRAQDENVKLQAVIADITQVNKRWQRYNTDRQMYVQKLLTTIQDQQVQINNMGETTAFPVKQPDIRSESCDRSECATMRDELKKLTENVQLLEFQVKAHKDDWEAERNEKREAIKERDHAKAQLQKTLRDLKAYKELSECHYCKNYNISCNPEQNYFCTTYTATNSPAAPPCHASGHHRSSVRRWLTCDDNRERDLQWDSGLEYSEELEPATEGASYSRSSTVGLSVSTSGSGPAHDELLDQSPPPVVRSHSPDEAVALPLVKSWSAPASSSRISSPPPTRTREPVVCPGCSKVFPPEANLKFLDHFENCQNS